MLVGAPLAAIYVRVPSLGWRRTDGAESQNLPTVLPDPDDRGFPGTAALLEFDLADATQPILTRFRDIGIERILAAPFTIAGETAAFLAVFDPLRSPSAEVRDALAAIALHLGTVLERISGADRFRAIADAIPQLVLALRPDLSVEWCNGRWTAFTGLSLEAMQDTDTQHAALHPDDFETIERAWETARSGDAPFEVVHRLRNATDGTYRWHLVRAVAMRDSDDRITRWFSTATDIDESRRAADVSQFLAEATEALGVSLDVKTTLRTLADVAIPELGDWCVIAQARTGGTLWPVAAAHIDPGRTQALIKTPFPPAGTSVALPIGGDGEVAFGYDSGGRGFDESMVRTAQELVQRASHAIENARRYEREHRVADALQRSLLPPYLPSARGLRFHAVYRPNAEEANVGGDWYDAFMLPSGHVALSIGDVGGHGLGAAITMGRVREMIRTAAIGDENPANVLARVDDVLSMSGNDTMITMLVGVIDRAALTFRYASAGHPAPLIAAHDRTVRVMPTGDVPLGLGFRALYGLHEIALVPDSLLVLYTDGLLEFERDVISGEARIVAAVADEHREPHVNRAEAIVERIIEGNAQDDIAVLAVSIDHIAAPVIAVTFDAAPESAPQARAVVSAFARELGMPEERLFDLTLAVGEATNNAIEHAYADGSPGTFAVRASLVEGRMVVEIEDRGMWRRRQRIVPSDPFLDERGRGISLMRMLCEGVSIERTAAGTVVRLAVQLRDGHAESRAR